MGQVIRLNRVEVQSGHRVRHAEGLIQQLPANHDGRNTWLLNYGRGKEAMDLRDNRAIGWDSETESAELVHFDNGGTTACADRESGWYPVIVKGMGREWDVARYSKPENKWWHGGEPCAESHFAYIDGKRLNMPEEENVLKAAGPILKEPIKRSQKSGEYTNFREQERIAQDTIKQYISDIIERGQQQGHLVEVTQIRSDQIGNVPGRELTVITVRNTDACDHIVRGMMDLVGKMINK